MLPLAGLIFDAAGNLYGTTDKGGEYGGRDGVRVVARRERGLDGEKLHDFGNGTDGADPDPV